MVCIFLFMGDLKVCLAKKTLVSSLWYGLVNRKVILMFEPDLDCQQGYFIIEFKVGEIG